MFPGITELTAELISAFATRGIFAGFQGDAWAGLGYLGTARVWLEHAVECLQALAPEGGGARPGAREPW